MEWLVPTADGRMLAVEDAGDHDGRPVMVHVGTPGGRRLFGPRTLADAERRQLRLISYDRPGYGGSTPQPGRSMADCASDVRVICEALGIDSLAMWGASGGGPHVLACAALLPDLVPAVASLASPASYDVEGLDWLAGFSPAAVDEVHLMLTDETAARALFRQEREKLLAAPPAEVALGIQEHAHGAGLALLTDEVVSIQQALAPGIEGSWDDCVAQLTRGGSTLATYRSRCCCCTAARIGPCHPATVSGWPRISAASKPGSSTTTGTPCGKATSKTYMPGS